MAGQRVDAKLDVCVIEYGRFNCILLTQEDKVILSNALQQRVGLGQFWFASRLLFHKFYEVPVLSIKGSRSFCSLPGCHCIVI
jgi:hypothetical protein